MVATDSCPIYIKSSRQITVDYNAIFPFANKPVIYTYSLVVSGIAFLFKPRQEFNRNIVYVEG